MKVLIAGRPNSGQKEALETLTSSTHDKDSFAGYVVSHTFQTKYFEVPIGVWTDEYTNADEWVSEFTSSDASEVRDALVLFIYTFQHVDAKISQFVESLGSRCASYALPQWSRKECSQAQLDELIDMGFSDVLDRDQLAGVAGGVFYDALQDEDEEEDADNEGVLQPELPDKEPRDLEEIMAELKAARESTSMTAEEKKQLADRLAAELL